MIKVPKKDLYWGIKTILISFVIGNTYSFAESQQQEHTDPLSIQIQQKRIAAITVSGNKTISDDAIISYIPYKVGEIFTPLKTRQLIHNVYRGLEQRFKNVTVQREDLDNQQINLHVIVEEKPPVKNINFTGNDHLSQKDINKKIDFASITAMDPQELPAFAIRIKKLYVEKGYNHVEIDTKFTIDDDQHAIVDFIIKEGQKSAVKRIQFIGNTQTSSKELRSVIMSKEDWLLSFLDKAGTYHPEMIEYADRPAIEHYYQDKGFLHAKVTNIVTDIDSETKNINLTYEIEEGDSYVISEVHVSGNDILPDDYLLAFLPLFPGMPYSREAITESIKRLERIWGNHGYIFTHIDPSIIPDDENRTVKVSFKAELGDKVKLNRITIRGNKKTRDKIIRRKISLEEGEPIIQDRMDASKSNVESLGYFEPREGVIWKIKRIDQEIADLDLIVKESKTGHFGLQLGFGGQGTDLRSPWSGASLKGEISDTNLLGSGIHLNASASASKDELAFLLHVSQPWLFDKPILGAMDLYHRRPAYDELHHVKAGGSRVIVEKLTGGSVTAGAIYQPNLELFREVHILGSFGIDNIRYDHQPEASIALARATAQQNAEFQSILDRSFKQGYFFWLANTLERNVVNHPIHPNRGHKWKFTTRFAIPTFQDNIGYYKVSLDVSWYTPLINEYDLIMHLHSYIGLTAPFKNRTAPFGELFHIGGPSSVRGFLFGQIGPKFLGDTIGAKKAFFINAELIFPIMQDMSMKGVIFYDGGAGWDNPYLNNVSPANITGNKFDYRHTVGVGVRILNPMPIKIDWGFKIDPRKGESTSEVHFGSSYDW